MINWLIGSLAVAIGLFAAWYFFCAREIRNVNAQIDGALDGLTADNAGIVFAKSELLAPAWKDFAASLTSDKKFSTASAAEFFSPQNLTVGLNMSFWQAYGGIFTGLGILGTFGGLVYGLYGVEMTSGDIDVLKSGIAKLLSGVETAFVTSLVGIFCAIVYSVVHHALIKSFREKVARLSARLDEIFPRQTAEDLLAKTLAEQQLHTAALQKLGDAIDKFTSGGADKVGEVFTQKVGSQMDNFSAALNDFTAAINEKLIKALDAHAEQTDTSADKFNKAVDTQQKLLEAATNKNVALINEAITVFRNAVTEQKDLLTTTTDNNAKQLNKAVDTQQKLLEAVTNKNVALINEAIKAFRNAVTEQKDLLTTATNKNVALINSAVNNFNKAVDANRDILEQMRQMLQSSANFLQAVDESGTKLNNSATTLNQATSQLLSKLPAIAEQMNKLLNANEFTRDNLNDLSTQVTTFTRNFNGLADEIERTVTTLRDALEHYNEVTDHGLQEKLHDFDNSMSAAVGYLNELAEDLLEADNVKHNQRR